MGKLERYDDKAEMMRAIFDSPEAWASTLAAMAKVAEETHRDMRKVPSNSIFLAAAHMKPSILLRMASVMTLVLFFGHTRRSPMLRRSLMCIRPSVS